MSAPSCTVVAAGEQEDIRSFFAQGHPRSGTLSNKEDGRSFAESTILNTSVSNAATTDCHRCAALEIISIPPRVLLLVSEPFDLDFGKSLLGPDTRPEIACHLDISHSDPKGVSGSGLL